MVFILAQDGNEALKFVKDMGLKPKDTRVIRSKLSLVGMPNKLQYYRVGHWYEREDLKDIELLLLEREAVEIGQYTEE